jgi:hypothetical protein
VGIPSSFSASSITQSRVIPSRISAVAGGVIRPPLRSKKMLAALASETKPVCVKKIASSYPAR